MNWIAKKPIDTIRVENLLKTCQDNNIYTNGGPIVTMLESSIEQLLGINKDRVVICCCNGTMALYALISGINRYHESNIRYATQAFTFPSSVQGPLINSLILDIDNDGALDLSQVDPKVVQGIIVTNVFGNVCDIDKYVTFARDNDLKLIFDNAATLSSIYKGTNCNNYGDASIVSFHHTKPLGFAEGGAIIVDKKYEYDIRCVLNYGIDNNSKHPHWDVYGSNYKMSEISAIYILQYLINYNMVNKHHIEMYNHIAKNLNNNIKLYPSFADTTVPSCICVLINGDSHKIAQKLISRGFNCRAYYHPLLPLQISQKFYHSIICIPCHLDISQELLIQVLDIINETLKEK